MSAGLVDFIKGERLKPTSVSGRALEEEILSDKARIVTSTALRRLQTKAQVFSLEQNAAVRTRLTHTLEVAVYGQWIANDVFSLLKDQGSLTSEYRLPFITTVENACLIHDIGNLPFGHLGEFAIQKWFRDKETAIKQLWTNGGVGVNERECHYWSFIHFDGNPQGLRVVSRLQWLKHQYGLNLTCSLLASLVKYLGHRPEEGAPFRKKVGYFETEQDIVKDVWSNLGLKTEKNGSPAQRHPLTFLMEAADDIAYCVSDIEDALEKGIVTEGFFFDRLPKNLEQFKVDNSSDYSEYKVSKDADFIDFKVALIRYLAKKAPEIFLDKYDEIINGSISKPLLQFDELARKALDFLKRFAGNHIFSSKEAVNVELTGYRIIHDLLDSFEPLLQLPPDKFKSLRPDVEKNGDRSDMVIERRLFSLLPNKHFLCYKHFADKHPKLETVYRTHLIVDYISGMTDSHAVKVFDMLTGSSNTGSTL